ncbi:MAG TPA: hypothetical protein VMZ53_21060 [Kofleriaceae bacterium]|nr:hypothetical protein [Kofleriaceae bacterium]
MKRIGLLLLLAGCQQLFGLEPPAHEVDASVASGSWREIAVGAEHTCAIKTDDTLWCWGGNYAGMAAAPSTMMEVTPPRQVNSERWLQLSSSYYHTCAIQADHSLWCWGGNGYGVIGDGTFAAKYDPTRVTGSWTHVSAGPLHTCALRTDASLWCWGHNATGALGDGSMTDSPIPVLVAGTWKDVAAGNDHTCAIATTGALWCWGSNARLQLSLERSTPVPALVDAGPWKQIAAGVDVTCGLLETGQLRCAGENSLGSLGRDTAMGNDKLGPVLLAGVDRTDWTSIQLAAHTACAVRSDAAGYCWGANEFGQLASAASTSSSRPVQLGMQKWTRLQTGISHTCGIDNAGNAWCVGNNSAGALGTPPTNRRSPTPIAGRWTDIAAGNSTTCAISTAGTASCAGFGISGAGGASSHQTMVQLAGSWDFIKAGFISKCGISGGELSCWGHNVAGEIGDGTTNASLVPMKITAAASVSISRHTCAIDQTQKLRCWGANDSGQAGVAGGMNVRVPTDIPGVWTFVSNGYSHTLGFDGLVLKSWGRGSEGQLGDGSMGSRSAPAAVGAFANSFKAAYAGAYHSCALDSSFLAWCWGANSYGQLGLGDTTVRSTPTPMPARKFQQLSLGFDFSCGIAEGGTLWCWGANFRGQLGVDTTLQSLTPIQVGTDTNWRAVAAGYDHACALKSDDTAWCWGANNYGQLADGTAWRLTLELVP